MQILNFDPNKLQIHRYHPHRVLKKRYFGIFVKIRIFMIFWFEKLGKCQKTGKSGNLFTFKAKKWVKKLFLAIFQCNVFEEPYKDTLYKKLANFDQN